MPETKYHDVIGVGFGPSNIALAITIEELFPELDVLFLEANRSSSWQSEMLFGDSDIQNHPLRDLVTPRNPRSKYTFTNFLFETGRLFEHLNLGVVFPFRTEYAQYVCWVADKFQHCTRYGSRVQRIEPLADETGKGIGYKITTDTDTYFCRMVVVAPGRSPHIPAAFSRIEGERVVHLTKYLSAIQSVMADASEPNIAVVGGSQSAVEIILHTARTYPQAKVAGFLQRYGYRLKDTSPFTGEVYFPEFVDLFYHADQATKARLRADLHLTNYSAADADVLDSLYRLMYQQKITGKRQITINRSADVAAAENFGDKVKLHYKRLESSSTQTDTFDLIVLATGFRDVGPGENQEKYPRLLESVLPHLSTDKQGCIQVQYDYSLKVNEKFGDQAPCYVNGLCESSHGMGDAGSFSLLSLRSKVILDSILERAKQDGFRTTTSRLERLIA